MLAWIIIIGLFTAPIWIWGITIYALKKWNDKPSGLTKEEEEKIWNQTLYGG